MAECSFDEVNKIWRGPVIEHSYGPHSSLGEEVLKALRDKPDHIFQICCSSGKEYTNRDIATLSIRVATHLRDNLKAQQGDIIAVCSANTDYVTPLVFGSIFAGLTVNLLDKNYNRNYTKHVYSLLRPTIVFCDGEAYQMVTEVLEELKLTPKMFTLANRIDGVPEIHEFLKETGTEETFMPEPLKDGINQTAVIACSSGTTGLPKLVTFSHAALLDLESLLDVKSLLYFGPLQWVSIPSYLAICTKVHFTRILSDKPFSAKAVVDTVIKYQVEGIYSASLQLAFLAGDLQQNPRDLSSLKFYVYGGSSLAPSLLRKLKPFMPHARFQDIYGMTEATGICSLADDAERACGTRLTVNLEMIIIDENGKWLGPNKRGEICIRRPYKWTGYYKNPESTAKTFVEGWLHTDDFGYFDDAQNMFIIDRKSEILKCSDHYVGPSEIEQVIHSLKGVREVCVYGISDAEATTVPAAAVIKLPDSQLTKQDVIEHVAQNAPDYMHLRGGVCFVDVLPKTATAKMIRSQIAEMCAQQRNKSH